MVKLCRPIFLTILIWFTCPSLGQVVLTPKNDDGLYKTGENAVWIVKPAPQSSTTSTTYAARYSDIANFVPKIKSASLVSFGLFDGTSPPTGVIAAFNLIAGPEGLLLLHSDHGGPGQQPRIMRREEWLSALVKGEPVTLKK